MRSSEESEDTRSSRSWSQESKSSAGPIDRSGTKRKKKRSSKKGGGKKSRRDKASRWTSSEDSDGSSRGSGRSDEDRGRSSRRGRRRFSPSPVRPPPRRHHNHHNLPVTDDAREEKMRLRKRAMVMGKFRFIVPEDGTEFEQTPTFRSTVARHYSGNRNRSVHYAVKPIGFRKVPRAQHSNTRYAILKADFPGIGDRFHVAWATPLGDVHVDGMVKLYDLRSIQMHCIDYDSRGPKSGWFGLVDPRIADTPDSKVHFDANMFWTVGLLYKHYGTCGVEDWDIEIAEMFNTHVVAENTNRLPQAGYSSASVPVQAVYSAGSIPPLMSLPSQPLQTAAAPPQAVQPQAVQQPVAVQQSQQPLPTGGGFSATAAAATSVTVNNLNAASSVRTTTATTTTTTSNHHVEGSLFTGCVTDWRGSYGFVSCNHIPRKIFLHSSVIEGWDIDNPQDLPIGSSVKFRVEYDAVRGYRASEAELFI